MTRAKKQREEKERCVLPLAMPAPAVIAAAVSLTAAALPPTYVL